MKDKITIKRKFKGEYICYFKGQEVAYISRKDNGNDWYVGSYNVNLFSGYTVSSYKEAKETLIDYYE